MIATTFVAAVAAVSLAGEASDWHAYNRMGLTADAEGRHEEALQHFAAAAQVAGRGAADARQAMATHNMASTHQRLGHGAEAARLYREAIDLWRRAGQPDSEEAGKAWGNLTVLLRGLARYKEALAAGREAARLLGGHGYFELAEVQRASGDLDGALESVRAGARKGSGLVAVRLIELEAMLLHETGAAAEAVARQRGALVNYETLVGPNDPYAVAARNNLGQMLLADGELEEAEQLLSLARSAAAAWQRPALVQAAIANNLAQIRRAQRRYADAEPLYREARGVAEAVLGPAHPEVAKITRNLGDLFLLQGKVRGAEQLYMEALTATERALGTQHRQTRQLAAALGAVYTASGRRTEYLRLMRRFAE